MNEVILAIRSRTQVFLLAENLKARQIPYKIISTPSEAGLACGISVKISLEFYQFAIKICQVNQITITAILEVRSFGGKATYKRL